MILMALLTAGACGPKASPEHPDDKENSNNTTDNTGDTPDAGSEEDPYLWLEEVQSEEALDWARAQNETTFSVLKADPRFETIETSALEVLESKDRIPYGSIRKGHVYNFWRDDKNVRGVWRRIPIADYLANKDTWETLLDIDKLAEDEGENWVYGGVSCLAPEFEKCILDLSIGGKDATVKREFDLKTKTFVEDGFKLPEAKSDISWVDADTVLVGTDFGEGSMTTSGYPRFVKVWKRGTPVSEARTVLEVSDENMGLWAWVNHSLEGRTIMMSQYISFYSSKHTLLSDDLTSTVELPFPEDLEINGIYKNRWAIAVLRSEWTVGAASFPQGAVVSIDLKPFKDAVAQSKTADASALELELIYAPDEQSSVRSVRMTQDVLLLDLLVDVKSRLSRMRKIEGQPWETLPAELPSQAGVASLVGVSDFESDFFIVYEDMLTPESLYFWNDAKGAFEPVRSIPARFDADGMRVEQRYATSKDGTKISYFVMLPKGFKEGEPRPTYLYGYGGFEISLLPGYSALTGRFWVERGGVYVLSNIRGGGEYGPRWHQAALKENRQRAYDDFHAIAEDLIARGVTTADQLGIHGGSNGGLLMGVAFTQRPDLYKGVICEVPLLDMKRYHTMLAGASWMAEYGDPDDPEQWSYIEKYSPYQNVKADAKYPRVFFTTSTADDRVHPAHARKMAARMLEQGHELFYFENIEGGHGGVTNQKQRAMTTALKFVYLMLELGLE